MVRLPWEELTHLPWEKASSRTQLVADGLSVSCLFVLPDGDLTDTISGPRSTASDLTSSKASTKSPTQRHNPFNEEQPEAVSSSDTTPVHATSQEKEEAQTPDQSDACTELEVIRSAGRGLGEGG